MQKYRDRYGIPGPEIANLAKRFYLIKDREGWVNTDAFLLWASQNGYRKGLTLRKRNADRPHGPDNSFFEDSHAIARERAEKFREYMEIQSPFCSQCTKSSHPESCGGCDEWRQYFVNNWNQNISIVKPEPEVFNNRRVFQYEHPDLVREGIEWRGN